MLRRKKSKGATYGKVVNNEHWRIEIYPLEHPTAFAKWELQRFRNSPIGWVEMGYPLSFNERKLCDRVAIREGYSRVA